MNSGHQKLTASAILLLHVRADSSVLGKRPAPGVKSASRLRLRKLLRMRLQVR